MNKNYYEFIFTSDQGKNITVKITNAIETYDIETFMIDMDSIISSEIILTASGKPAARRKVNFIEPKTVNVTVQNN